MLQDVPGLLPSETTLPIRVVAALLFGRAIDVVSSPLGVAGGELIILTLMLALGADIKAAGTASLLVSFPTVAVEVLRHHRLGAYSERRDLTETVAPMDAGLVLGAVVGGVMVGVVPAVALKLLLRVILIVSAVRIFAAENVEPWPWDHKAKGCRYGRRGSARWTHGFGPARALPRVADSLGGPRSGARQRPRPHPRSLL